MAFDNDSNDSIPVAPGTLNAFALAYFDAPAERTFVEIPDGEYQVNVDKVELVCSREKQIPMLKWTMRVIAPDKYAGRMMWKNNLIREDSIPWLKQDLVTAGYMGGIAELEANLGELINEKLEVTRKSKKGDNGKPMANIYINRKLELSELPQDSVAGPNDGVIPF